jgi:hypothetical protein
MKKMKYIAFTWTTAALLAGRKTCTRRDWDVQYARRFDAGDKVIAIDRRLMYGGARLGLVTLGAKPSYERIADMPDSDYEAEGFAYYEEHPEHVPPGDPLEILRYGAKRAFELWRQAEGMDYVIRFPKGLCVPTMTVEQWLEMQGWWQKRRSVLVPKISGLEMRLNEGDRQ